jgi:hypothetical protein
MKRCPVVPALLTALAIPVLGACVDRLPDQDLRILGTTAVAKLPVEALAADYRADRAAADRQYWSKPIEVSGEVTETRESAGGPVLVFLDKSGTAIVEATLLDEQAAAIRTALGDSKRVRLKCYCDGLSSAIVRLKSCVVP